MRRAIIDVDPIPHDLRDAARRGPRDERLEARSRESRHVADNARDLIQRGLVQDLGVYATGENPLYQKVKRSLPQSQFAKAQASDVYKEGVALATIDPLHRGAGAHLHLQRPIGLDWRQLREVVRRGILIELAIATRIAQMRRFTRPSRFEWQPGFKVSFADPTREVGEADQRRFHLIAQFLQSCGMTQKPSERRQFKRDDLKDFIAKHLRDSLTMDAAPVELVSTFDGRLHGFVAQDAARVLLTDPTYGLLDTGYEAEPELNILTKLHAPDPADVFAVRVVDGDVTAHYTHEQLIYPIRNPDSDEERYGYGSPEPERILKIQTGFLDALNYNMRGLTDNSVPPGVMVLWGEFQEDDLSFMQEEWLSQGTGSSNRHRLPVLNVKDKQQGGVDFISTGTPVSDVTYAKWITLTTAITCASYLMDPAEISFESYSAGNNSSLSGDDTEEKLASSKDKGLHSLVDFTFDTLNEIVQELDPEVQVEPTGLTLSKKEALDLDEKLGRWGETRSAYGRSNDGIPDELLEMPLNPTLTNVANGLLQAQKQEAAQEKQMQQGQPTGAEKDVDGDGQPEQAMDMDGDGRPEAYEDVDPKTGDRRLLDHTGQEWHAHTQGGDGDADDQTDRGADDDNEDEPRPFAKAVEVSLYNPLGE